MATPFKVRGLRTNRYKTSKYIIYNIYLLGIKDGKAIILRLRQELYLIEDLKINILIGNNILASKGSIADLYKKEAFITSTSAIIILNIKSIRPIQRIVYLR